jgi:hypothetical protein
MTSPAEPGLIEPLIDTSDMAIKSVEVNISIANNVIEDNCAKVIKTRAPIM